jgi:hypothetical protein
MENSDAAPANASREYGGLVGPRGASSGQLEDDLEILVTDERIVEIRTFSAPECLRSSRSYRTEIKHSRNLSANHYRTCPPRASSFTRISVDSRTMRLLLFASAVLLSAIWVALCLF